MDFVKTKKEQRMKPLILDVETTTHAKGNPFSEQNKLCYVGLYNSEKHLFDVEYSNKPYKDTLEEIQKILNDHDVIVGFNLKFDLHWIRQYGLDFSHMRAWDCQLVHFILTNQQNPYPSLNDVAEHYNLEKKLDEVSEQYWKNGIDTTEIPKEMLEEYLEQDLKVTHNVFINQVKEYKTLPPQRQRLLSLHNQDLIVLQEMEFNGIMFEEEKSLQYAQDMEEQIIKINTELYDLCGVGDLNFNSNDHLSCLLYGGRVTIPKKEVVGIYKTGDRKGEEKLGWVDHHYDLPRLVEPLKGSELKKDRYYSTDEQTLRSLRGSKNAKKIIECILTRSTLEKRRGTYYNGLPDLRQSQGWAKGKLHGQLNQCVARTGRLSSSRPNLQNFDGEIKELFYSRYQRREI